MLRLLGLFKGRETSTFLGGTIPLTKFRYDPTIIKTNSGNINIEGTTIANNAGKTYFIAENGDVTIKERILNTREDTQKASFNVVSSKAEASSMRTQKQAENSVSSYDMEVKAKNFKVEGINIDTIGDMIVDAENVELRGQRLDSHFESNSFSIGVIPAELKISISSEKASCASSEYVNQTNSIGGKMIFKNVKNGLLQNSNIVADEFEGKFDKKIINQNFYRRSPKHGDKIGCFDLN